MRPSKLWAFALFITLSSQAQSLSATAAPVQRPELSEIQQIKSLNLVQTLELPFKAHHPQGIVKVGNFFYLTTVDKEQRRGYLYKFHRSGKRLELDATRELTLENGEFHPGGIDYDPMSGKLVTAVAQYRSHSSSTLIRIDPQTLEFEALGRVNDHIGCVFVEKSGASLHFFNWDAVDTYTVDSENLDGSHGSELIGAAPIKKASDKEYQDCKFLGTSGHFAITTGQRSEAFGVKNGYLSIIEVDAKGVIHEVGPSLPAKRVSEDGSDGATWLAKPLSQNPIDLERIEKKGQPRVRFYFVPYDDDKARLMIFDGEN